MFIEVSFSEVYDSLLDIPFKMTYNGKEDDFYVDDIELIQAEDPENDCDELMFYVQHEPSNDYYWEFTADDYEVIGLFNKVLANHNIYARGIVDVNVNAEEGIITIEYERYCDVDAIR